MGCTSELYFKCLFYLLLFIFYYFDYTFFIDVFFNKLFGGVFCVLCFLCALVSKDLFLYPTFYQSLVKIFKLHLIC